MKWTCDTRWYTYSFYLIIAVKFIQCLKLVQLLSPSLNCSICLPYHFILLSDSFPLRDQTCLITYSRCAQVAPICLIHSSRNMQFNSVYKTASCSPAPQVSETKVKVDLAPRITHKHSVCILATRITTAKL